MTSHSPARSRCLVVWLSVTGTGAALARLVTPDLVPVAGSFESWLLALSAWALCAAALWASAVTGIVAAQVLRDAPVPVRGLPAPMRRVLLRACGVAVTGTLAAGLSAGPALATPGSLERDRPAPAASTATGVPAAPEAPVAPAGPVTPVGPVTSVSTVNTPAATSGVVVVRPGGSLWEVTESVLARRTGQEPTDADVATAWPRLYDANRDLVGPDPHLVRPGVPLSIPADLADLTDLADDRPDTEES